MTGDAMTRCDVCGARVRFELGPPTRLPEWRHRYQAHHQRRFEIGTDSFHVCEPARLYAQGERARAAVAA